MWKYKVACRVNEKLISGTLRILETSLRGKLCETGQQLDIGY